MRGLYKALKGKSVEELSGYLDRCKEKLKQSKGRDVGTRRVMKVIETVVTIKVTKIKGWRMKGCKHGKV